MTKHLTPPHGISRLLWRAPILLYKAGLGWLLGKRFLLLTHTGRKSGKSRYAVIEIMRYDRPAKRHIVASGFGERSDWFRNVQKTPAVIIQIGNNRQRAHAHRLPYPEALKEMAIYAQDHPTALRNLARIMGYEYDGSQANLERLAQAIPILAFDHKDGG